MNAGFVEESKTILKRSVPGWAFAVINTHIAHIEKAKWTTAEINDLPDSAFLHIEGGGEKDEDKRTVPRTLRHFPVKGPDGEVDLPHLRNALARISQSNLSQNAQDVARRKAEAMLEAAKNATISKAKKPNSREYLEEAFNLARKALPGWAFAVISQRAKSKVGGRRSRTGDVPWAGPENARLAFVGSSPGEEEYKAKAAMSGPNAKLFEEKYLAPLGLKRADVALGYLVPKLLHDDRGRVREPSATEIKERENWFKAELDRLAPRAVVALGQTARQSLGDGAHFVLPHPASVRTKGDSGEVDRKMRKIRDFLSDSASSEKKLDELAKNGQELTKRQDSASNRLADGISRSQKLADGISEEEPREGELLVHVAKQEPAKQIVYGVVMDPYGQYGPQFDAHGDWFSPADVERDAHNFTSGPVRKIRIQHRRDSNASMVESWVEQYPSPEDYRAAMNEQPHKVTRRKFGNDVVHSGSWVMGVKLGDAEWKDVEDGKFNNFSPGGVGVRRKMEAYEMPEVTFVDPEGVPL